MKEEPQNEARELKKPVAFVGHYELVDIRTFVAVVEAGSISKAARRLEIAKSVVSQRVARLEAALETTLLRRSTRGVRLTERGALYLDQVSEGLLALDLAAESLVAESTEVSGNLRLTVPTSFANSFLSPLLMQFLMAHPRISMQLELHDHRVDLAAEGFDLGIRITGQRSQGSEKWIPLGLSRRVVCCSPAYLKKHGTPRNPSEIGGHPGIGYTNLADERLWSFSRNPKSRPSPPSEGRLATNSGDMMRDAALAGFGITVLPLFIVAEDLRAGRLVRLLPHDEPKPDRIFIVCAPRRARLLRVQLLTKFIQNALAGTPPWERSLPPPQGV